MIFDSAPESIKKIYLKVWCLKLFELRTFYKKWGYPAVLTAVL